MLQCRRTSSKKKIKKKQKNNKVTETLNPPKNKINCGKKKRSLQWMLAAQRQKQEAEMSQSALEVMLVVGSPLSLGAARLNHAVCILTFLLTPCLFVLVLRISYLLSATVSLSLLLFV